ncbi:MAG: FHA domain-containing protein [Planctomycetes bacterium]|nr:FHA domain-containing protein [Planctomycetota bacterium]
MDVKLIVLDGPKAGHGITVKRKSFFIGRGEDCQLRARSDRISRRHCELIVSETTVLLRDHSGKNGTFVNDKRVDGEQQLESGDRLKVGPLRFKIVMSASAGVKERPEEKLRPAQKDTKPAASSSDESTKPSDESTKPSAGDIDSWLSDDDAPLKPLKPLKRDPASPQRKRVDEAVTADDPDEAEADSQDDASADPKSGKLPPPPKSINSREAADEMLRRMRRGS